MSTQNLQKTTCVAMTRDAMRRTPHQPKRILIAGTGKSAVAVARCITESGEPAVICGATDPEPQGELSTAFPELPWLGSFDSLAECLIANCIDELHIALPLRSFARVIGDLQAAAADVGVRVTVHIDLSPGIPGAEATAFGDGFAITSPVHASLRGLGRFLKRTLDVVVAGTALVLLSPLLFLIALGIVLTSRGPVLFRQERVGRGQRVFQMLKFRSMVANAEELRAVVAEMNNARGISFKVFDDPRVTRIGGLLRRSSLDELPQLWNVIRGDMSLVGPRPIPVWVADQLRDPKLYRRFTVQPGLTGLWQVEGRQQDFDWMAMQDLRYIDKWSIRSDVRILLATIPAMIRGEGAH